MKKHIILFLLLAIAFTAIAAPAATPKTPAKKVMSLILWPLLNPLGYWYYFLKGGCRRFTSPILHTPPHKSVPTKQRLVRRSDIQLCGRNIRSKTADKCRDNPGYIENSSGKLEWVPGNVSKFNFMHLIVWRLSPSELPKNNPGTFSRKRMRYVFLPLNNIAWLASILIHLWQIIW